MSKKNIKKQDRNKNSGKKTFLGIKYFLYLNEKRTTNEQIVNFQKKTDN